jgi:methionyl-tRNA formyltransferase
MEAGLDNGPLLLQRALGIGIDDTAAQIHEELAQLGAKLVVQALEGLVSGGLYPVQQDSELATYAPKLCKEEGWVDWDRPAREVHNQIRALYPWPGTYFDWPMPGGKKTLRLRVFPGRIGREKKETEVPGTLVGLEDQRLAMVCADRIYLLPAVQPAGRGVLGPKDFSCGYLSSCPE